MEIQLLSPPSSKILDEALSEHRFAFKAVKRFFDIILVVFSLPVTLPLILLIGFLVKLDSKGTVFYTQRRGGRSGKTFTIYKFRTMKMNHCTAYGGKQVCPNDKRVTKMGHFLRQTSLDELPQIFNILKGDMSIVGPRPHAIDHNDYYNQRIAHYHERHRLKPGLTGLAQINGLRGQTKTVEEMAQRVYYDLIYIRQQSLFFDIKIILLTFKELLFSKNAY